MPRGPRQARYCVFIPRHRFHFRQLPACCGRIRSAAFLRDSRGSRNGMSMKEAGDSGCRTAAEACAPMTLNHSRTTGARRTADRRIMDRTKPHATDSPRPGTSEYLRHSNKTDSAYRPCRESWSPSSRYRYPHVTSSERFRQLLLDVVGKLQGMNRLDNGVSGAVALLGHP